VIADGFRIIQFRCGQDQREFFPAISRCEILALHIALQNIGNQFQNLIPGLVSICVVEFFEKVDIRQGETQRLAIFHRLHRTLAQGRVEHLAICNSCQGVRHRLALNILQVLPEAGNFLR